MVLRIFCLLLALAATISVRSTGVERDLARLDSCIQMKTQFDKQKEERLQILKGNLKSASEGNARYSVLYSLFTEYESYNFDSAYHYAREAANQSVVLKNRDYQVEAGCAIVFCYLSAGLYKEAFDVMEMIDHDGVGKEYQQQYYMMWSRLYYDFANYNNSQPYEQEYVRRGNRYVDTLLQYVPEMWTDKWLIDKVMQFDFDYVVVENSIIDSNNEDLNMAIEQLECIDNNEKLKIYKRKTE